MKLTMDNTRAGHREDDEGGCGNLISRWENYFAANFLSLNILHSGNTCPTLVLIHSTNLAALLFYRPKPFMPVGENAHLETQVEGERKQIGFHVVPLYFAVFILITKSICQLEP